jgi:hypothetical protein
MNITPVLTKQQLKEANAWAIEVGYNRAMEPGPLLEYLDSCEEDTKFPITLSISHNHAAGIPVEEHFRCRVILDGTGSSGMIDIDADLFQRLERIQVPENSEE